LRNAGRWPDFPTTNGGGPRGPRNSRAAEGARGVRGASRRDAHFFVGTARGRPGVGAVHLQRLFKRITEVFQQFFAGLALGVDAWDFLDPANPPFAVLLDDGGITRCHHGPPIRMTGQGSQQTVYYHGPPTDTGSAS